MGEFLRLQVLNVLIALIMSFYYDYFISDRMSTPEQELLTKYLLSRLLDKGVEELPESSRDQDPASSIVYPQVIQQRIRRPLQKILDQAKENIDVIDFRNPKKQVSVISRHVEDTVQCSISCKFTVKIFTKHCKYFDI